MDLQKREQLVLVIRYLTADEDGVLRQREDPVAMLDLVRDVADDCEPHSEKKLIGVAIGNAILRQISKLDLDLSQCVVAQCYDGASAMASELVGVAAQILQQAELADYCHCMAHWMNLSASQAVKVAAIRSAQIVVQEAASLFRTSAKKTAALKQCIEDADDTRVSKRQLISLCETRFLERHTAVVTFRQLFGFVAKALQEIKTWNSASAVRSASSQRVCFNASVRVCCWTGDPGEFGRSPVVSVTKAAGCRQRPNTGFQRRHRSKRCRLCRTSDQKLASCRRYLQRLLFWRSTTESL